MFRANDEYFGNIDCPHSNCKLLNCFFNHNKSLSRKRPLNEVIEIDQKRLRTDDICPKTIHHLVISKETRDDNLRKLVKYFHDHNDNDNNDNNDNNIKAVEKEFELAIKANSIDEYQQLIDTYILPEQKDPEFILPKQLMNAPATLPIRKSNIENLCAIIRLNEPRLKTPKLKAIDEEYKIASSTSKHTYMHTIKKKIHEMKNPAKYKPKTTELTNDDYFDELNKQMISKEKLIKYGFIMDIPEPVKPTDERICRRCGKEFLMSNQLEPIHCSFHAGKSFKKDRKRVYECCGAVVGDNESEPCTSYNYHVFHWNGPGEMQAFCPFQRTNEYFEKRETSYKALGIDCEMGYTTKGFELLRITAVDFFSGNEVIDILVKPKGEVIDLNSRWSGIHEIAEDALEFEESIKLLNSVMDYDTILIGHGLENDMNSMRLIHNKIVDTAILYPRLKTSPKFRYSLKHLVFTYLGKTIQTGQHDSGEDALGAIDIVKYFIKKDLT